VQTRGKLLAVPDLIEAATSARAKCRACDQTIAKGQLRYGEAYENPYGEGEAMRWYHLDCAALRLPDRAGPFFETSAPEAERERLLALVAEGTAHPRLARVGGVERASSGRATCRSCRELIEKGAIRIVLQMREEGRFTPSGFVHARCLATYAECPTEAAVVRVSHHTSELDDATREELLSTIRASNPGTPGSSESNSPESNASESKASE
jgi:hypothetical protein